MIAQVARLTGEIDDLLSPTPQRRRAREVAAPSCATPPSCSVAVKGFERRQT